LKQSEQTYPDNQRFKSVIERYSPQLRNYIASRIANGSDVQDLAQEAYLRLMRVKRPEFIRKPEAYLFRIASNLVNEYYLKQAKDPATITLDQIQHTGQDGDGAAFERVIDHRAEIVRLESLLDDLPPFYRAVVLLRKRDGYSHLEIAEKLNLAPSTVHTYLKRALTHCRSAGAK